ncbi:MAG TPA: agmatinase [Casimicrobiaceae bacterium]|nr:agmatinase [Casimicrobiaceae bacterium]
MSDTVRGDGAIRRDGPYGRSVENTFAGVLSFMRRKYTRDLSGVEVAVSGIPLDLATTFRPGARFGPAAIRAASVQLAELKPFPWGFDPFETLAVIDYGDCWLDANRPATITATIMDHARSILASGAMMLTFGGDHYITYPLLKAHVEKLGRPVSLIHFDAHRDMWPDEGPDSVNHGTMFYRAVKEGLIDVEHSVQVGIRTWTDDALGVEALDAPWVHAHGPRVALERIVERVGAQPAYLTFDIDCLDPAYAPGTGTPVPGGLTSAQALHIVRGLEPVNLIGTDIVEVAPPYDQSEITALAAAHLAADLLCVLRNRKLTKG